MSAPENLHAAISDAPIYSDVKVPADYCSRYARFAAKDLFGIEYPAANAWQLRDMPEIRRIPLSDGVDLESLARDGRLAQGMLVGTYNPSSAYNGKKEVMQAGYTHVLLFLGKDGNGRLWFADKFEKITRKMTAQQLQESGLEPREILYKGDENSKNPKGNL